MIKDIDKTKLVFVHNNNDIISDVPFETKEISYYRDSWNRFKKNKASTVSFVIILIMLFFVIFGPFIKNYDLPDTNKIESERFEYLPPKIPLLEKLGIFDGEKEISRGKNFLIALATSEYGKDIIIDMPQSLKDLIDDDPTNDEKYSNLSNITVTVDYYKYLNFTKSFLPDNYFNPDSTYANSLQPVIRTINSDELFQEYLENNYIIDIISIKEETKSDGTISRTYYVRYDQFKAALDQTPEDTYFWFGTTGKGQDLFTEIWNGARISLIMAVSVLIVNSLIGLTIGAFAGYYGGTFDLLFDRFVEILSSIPFLPILTLLIIKYGTATWVVLLAFTVTGWIGFYSTGRMQFYRFKNREYILAARTLGASDKRIMFKHIFPNAIGYIITGMALSIPSFVFSEASYSYLGIINYDNATSVGMLINQGESKMQTYPHLLIYPSLYIAILMIAFNLFGNGLRDAFNPSLRGVE